MGFILLYAFYQYFLQKAPPVATEITIIVINNESLSCSDEVTKTRGQRFSSILKYWAHACLFPVILAIQDHQNCKIPETQLPFEGSWTVFKVKYHDLRNPTYVLQSTQKGIEAQIMWLLIVI